MHKTVEKNKQIETPGIARKKDGILPPKLFLVDDDKEKWRNEGWQVTVIFTLFRLTSRGLRCCMIEQDHVVVKHF